MYHRAPSGIREELAAAGYLQVFQPQSKPFFINMDFTLFCAKRALFWEQIDDLNTAA